MWIIKLYSSNLQDLFLKYDTVSIVCAIWTQTRHCLCNVNFLFFLANIPDLILEKGFTMCLCMLKLKILCILKTIHISYNMSFDSQWILMLWLCMLKLRGKIQKISSSYHIHKELQWNGKFIQVTMYYTDKYVLIQEKFDADNIILCWKKTSI